MFVGAGEAGSRPGGGRPGEVVGAPTWRGMHALLVRIALSLLIALSKYGHSNLNTESSFFALVSLPQGDYGPEVSVQLQGAGTQTAMAS